MDEPSEVLLTVLMTVHNGSLYIDEAITSILNQTFSDFNFLIIDNASDDSTVEIIKTFNDPRINLIELSTNIGQTRALNKGLELMSGLKKEFFKKYLRHPSV